jgi:hypothetical protein
MQRMRFMAFAMIVAAQFALWIGDVRAADDSAKKDDAAAKRFAGGDEHKAYFLIGADGEKPKSEGGYKLLLVLPGGAGSAGLRARRTPSGDSPFDRGTSGPRRPRPRPLATPRPAPRPGRRRAVHRRPARPAGCGAIRHGVRRRPPRRRGNPSIRRADPDDLAFRHPHRHRRHRLVRGHARGMGPARGRGPARLRHGRSWWCRADPAGPRRCASLISVAALDRPVGEGVRRLAEPQPDHVHPP